MEQENFFAGLKVVELASVLAGPAVGLFFAELGAEVIKIENKGTGGDVTRRWKLPEEDQETRETAYYCSVNYGKEVRMLDLTDRSDRQQFLGLIREADLVVSNFRPASVQKLNLDYVSLQAVNPRLIYAQLTGFGEGVERPAFDVVLQAEAGFLYMTGEPDRDPVRMPVALIDLLAAHQLKEGILLALLRRERTGRGSYVSTSLFESAVASLANQATNWLMAGHVPGRMGTQHPNIAPYGDIFYTKDKKPVVIAVGTERQFASLCTCLDVPALAKHPDFAANASRVRHREALRERLSPHFARYDREELLTKLNEQSVPVASIRTMPEVFELPTARAMILEDELPDGRTGRRVQSVAFRLI